MISENKKIILGIVAVVLFAGTYFLNPNFDSPTRTNFCTMDAKQCSDGSYVGRTGPKCEFEACPNGLILPSGYTLENYEVEKITGEMCQQDKDCKTPGEYLVQSRCPFISICLENKCAVVCPGHDEWKTYIDPSREITFKSPETLSTKYIYTVDWPPEIDVLDKSFSCTGSYMSKQIIGNREYCIRIKSEGAAGSIYNQYGYVSLVGDKMIAFSFSLRFSQCVNYYGLPEQSECEEERKIFNVDSMVNRIFQTLEIKK